MQSQPGIVNLEQLNAKLVEQDQALRSAMNYWVDQMTQAVTTERILKCQAELMSEAFAAIHERLGNMMIYGMSSG